MILDGELHSPKNEAGRISDHLDADRLQMIRRSRVIQLIGFVVSLPFESDRASNSR
jgi:hypothetical protein